MNFHPNLHNRKREIRANNLLATEFLGKLDNDPVIGSMVDCTSNYENESAEMARANPPVDLTPDLWVLKLILGCLLYTSPSPRDS